MATPAKKKPITRSTVVESTSPRRRRRWLRRTLWIFFLLAALGVAVFAVLLVRTQVPTPNELATSEATVVYYADGVTEIGRLGESTRRSVPLSDIPLEVQQAVFLAT